MIWFRRDLRLSDNPALSAAADRGRVIPVYIDDHDSKAPWAEGAGVDPHEGARRVIAADGLRGLNAGEVVVILSRHQIDQRRTRPFVRNVLCLDADRHVI